MLLLRVFLITLFVLTISSCLDRYSFNDRKQPNTKSKEVNTEVSAEVNTEVNTIELANISNDNITVIDGFKNKIISNTNCDNIDINALTVENFTITEGINECLEASPEFYDYLLFLHKHNAKKASKQLHKFINDNSTRYIALELVVAISDKRMMAWLNRKSTVIEPILIKPTPVKKVERITVEQQEFETTVNFNIRVDKEKRELQDKIQQDQDNYRAKLESYYRIQESYIFALRAEKDDRKKQSRAKYLEFLGEEIRTILGNPYFSKLKYNPDNYEFNAILSSSNSDWQENVVIKVPIEDAKTFKDEIVNVRPVLDFDINSQGELYIANIIAKFDSQDYTATLVNDYRYKLKSEVVEGKFGDWL